MGWLDKFRRKKQQMVIYNYLEEELNEYEAYIEKALGGYDEVFHEIVSPDIHLDIIIVPPTNTHPYYKLVTMGMGAYTMAVPEDLKTSSLEHAELVIYLPKDWDIRSCDERDYWPIRYLKILGRLPLECDTWLGYGHSVHGNQEMEPLADNTQLNSFVLLNANDLNGKIMKLELSSGKTINFYQLFPLYQEELEIKQAYSTEALIELFNNEDRFPILNIQRKNYGK